ncbi:DUF6415 family natural product biosynthesis protein [Streptomyces lunaelactis]|uniref:DUF6415 family natural product biosynthesis protein n=1 Tax=Streptomyces lunaelactis TaxID=1535768 RepID=UPI0034D95431
MGARPFRAGVRRGRGGPARHRPPPAVPRRDAAPAGRGAGQWARAHHAEAIQQTADYVLSRHLDTAQDGELDATVLTLQGYLTALAQEAEAQLDTGRVVVREILSRARALADEECRPSQKCARHAAQTARDLLALLSREGWGTASTARVAQGHGR